MSAVEIKVWGEKETSVYGHLLLPRRARSKLNSLVYRVADYIYNLLQAEEYIDSFREGLMELGLKLLSDDDVPISIEELLKEVIGGKKFFDFYARSKSGDLYVLAMTYDYSELRIFQFTKCDVALFRLYSDLLGEGRKAAELARNIMHEEMEMLRVASELVNDPVLPQVQGVNLVKIFSAEAGDREAHVYLVPGKHGLYIIAYTIPAPGHWENWDWKALDIILRRVDPDMVCFEEKGCRLLRELL